MRRDMTTKFPNNKPTQLRIKRRGSSRVMNFKTPLLLMGGIIAIVSIVVAFVVTQFDWSQLDPPAYPTYPPQYIQPDASYIMRMVDITCENIKSEVLDLSIDTYDEGESGEYYLLYITNVQEIERDAYFLMCEGVSKTSDGRVVEVVYKLQEYLGGERKLELTVDGDDILTR